MKKIWLRLLAPCLMFAVLLPAGCKKANPKIRVEMEDGGVFVLELYPEYAPKTVENFVGLVEKGFYDGLTFHRIVDGFMVQGGDPLGNGSGGSGVSIAGEFASNGYAKNTLKHTAGVISMARTDLPDSATSQFFIMLDDAQGPYLDGDYAAFGRVVEGMDVVLGLVNVERTYNSFRELAIPVEPVVIKQMTVVK